MKKIKIKIKKKKDKRINQEIKTEIRKKREN